MKRELLEYLLQHAHTVELKLHDEMIGTYFETVTLAPSYTISENVLFVDDFPYSLKEIVHARFIGSEDEIVERINAAPSLELAMLFTQETITPLVEIALNALRTKLLAEKQSNFNAELETACKASKLTVARVLQFIGTNYGVSLESDWEGVKRLYKQAIEKLTTWQF